LRVSGPGDYRYKGGDLGILVSRGRFQTDDGKLTERARRWVNEIKGRYVSQPLEAEASELPIVPLAIKGS
jgi:hypothetical protein